MKLQSYTFATCLMNIHKRTFSCTQESFTQEYYLTNIILENIILTNFASSNYAKVVNYINFAYYVNMHY